MEQETLKGHWNEMKGNIQKKWGELTNDEINQVEGDYNQFLGLLQQKYGESKSNLKEDLNNFIREYKEPKSS